MPDPHALFVLAMTAAALVLFARDRVPPEAAALGVLVTLLVVFQLIPYSLGPANRFDPTRLFAGFGHEALIAVAALTILAKGLQITGALQPLAQPLANLWNRRPRQALLVTMALAATLSAFVNNTPVVMMMLPMLIGVTARSKTMPSSVLMPVGFAALIGGLATTIGTSTNLLVAGIAEDLGAPRFGLFEFTLPALVVGALGLLYLWLIAPKLLPARKPPLGDTSPRVFNATLHITEESAAAGRTFAECLALTGNRMRVDRLVRGEGLVMTKLPNVRVLAGDRFVVRDTPERLKEFEQQLGATLHEDGTVTTTFQKIELEQLAEIVVTRGSALHKASLAATRFAQRTGLLPLALHRARAANEEPLSSHIGLVPLRAGDVVLVQGTSQNLERLKQSGTALVLDGTTDLPRTHRADRALSIMLLVIALAALGIVSISVSAVIGVGLMLATRCLGWREIASALSAPLIMVIVTSLALGQALTVTGASEWVAGGVAGVVASWPVPVVLSLVILAVTLVTSVVPNNVAGIIGATFAVPFAVELGAPVMPFVLAVLFGANMSYASPFGYQTNLLLLSSGGYRFADFVRAGVPLTVIMWLGFSFVLPVIYGL